MESLHVHIHRIVLKCVLLNPKVEQWTTDLFWRLNPKLKCKILLVSVKKKKCLLQYLQLNELILKFRSIKKLIWKLECVLCRCCWFQLLNSYLKISLHQNQHMQSTDSHANQRVNMEVFFGGCWVKKQQCLHYSFDDHWRALSLGSVQCYF